MFGISCKNNKNNTWPILKFVSFFFLFFQPESIFHHHHQNRAIFRYLCSRCSASTGSRLPKDLLFGVNQSLFCIYIYLYIYCICICIYIYISSHFLLWINGLYIVVENACLSNFIQPLQNNTTLYDWKPKPGLCWQQKKTKKKLWCILAMRCRILLFYSLNDLILLYVDSLWR